MCWLYRCGINSQREIDSIAYHREELFSWDAVHRASPPLQSPPELCGKLCCGNQWQAPQHHRDHGDTGFGWMVEKTV
ncbi:hypothetical protein E2C01_067218 [Portunus trituberculatus]|uniref:Uncharacterized protein n=1 Tax=Portunus trituberculatus TaxID=210409 RepID=A0A5B7HT21_PORTR|nr:hypothetical protein [Portunus trituberculatus]